MILEILLASQLSLALDESVGATAEGAFQSTGEALGMTTVETAGIGTEATIAYLGPELSSTLVVGTTAVFATAVTYWKWQESETRQRYRDAANEGMKRLARGEQTPITNSPEDSSLRMIAGLERFLNPVATRAAGEDKIVRLIALRAKKLE